MSIENYILRKVPARLVSWSFRKIFGKKNLEVFKRILEIPKWKKVTYDSPEKWIFEDDNSFVIEISDKSRDFTEKWTDCFPDKNAGAVEVYLKINNELVNKPLLFIGVDGWRYFVPCPKISDAYDERYWYWDKESLEYKVSNVIGSVDYLYDSLESFGRACGVSIK